MGCSPSRGNNFSETHGPFRRGKTLRPGTNESPGDSQSDDGGNGSSGGGETDGEACERAIAEKKLSNCGDSDFVSLGKKHLVAETRGETITSEKLGTQEITINLSETKEKQDEKKDDKKGTKKSKKCSKSAKPGKKKEKEKKSAVEEKVDFPEPLVKAHQAAYGYLNPSIAKYEILLGLLDHAAETQISLQPMVAFMVLRYEEINQGLEDMIEEGEQLLKENGEHLAWPCNMKNLSSSSSTKSRPSSTEPPPDLLQQLLQYTVQRMHLVGQSMRGIGDTALEEAVDYFSSISEVLEEKLKTKRAAEARLMQLLTRIEAASLRRPGPEDSALFSEDSGIGVESESLAGSDRQRHRRESCESTGSNRTILCSPGSSTPIHQGSSRQLLTKKMSTSSSQNSIDSACTIVGTGFRDTESLLGSTSLDDGEGEDEEEENGEASEEEQCKGKIRKQSNSSPSDHQPRRLPAKRIENPQNVEMTLKMKDAISGRINFVSTQRSGMKTKPGTSKNSDGQWTEEGEKNPKRPQTGTSRGPKKKTTVPKQGRSKSAESLRSKAEDPTLLELERTQKELSQRLEKMRMVRFDGNIRKGISKQLHGQETQTGSLAVPGQLHPLNKNLASPNIQKKTANTKTVVGKQESGNGKEEEKKKKDKALRVPLKATPPPSPPLSPREPLGMKGNSVKKLIDTFSQGMEESKQLHESVKMLGPLKGVRKCGVPIIPGLGGADIFPCNENSSITCRESSTSERTDDLDLDNLPPPPPEVLMDNSFENIDKTEESISRRGRSTAPKKTTMSQRLRASVQSVAVLPSKGSVRKSSLSMSPARTVPQDPSTVVKISQLGNKPEVDPEKEEAASLYKQARKIIHLRHSTGSPTEKLASENSNVKSCLQVQSNSDRKESGNNTPETVPSTPVVESEPPATPPVSRTRMLPSAPILHRRLPSPPVFKRQPVHPSSSSPPVIRKLPTPPPTGQRTLPSTPAIRQQTTPSSTSSTPAVTFPFKAPSPPASPKVQRWSQQNSKDDSASRVFSNARSVFCPASPSLFEAQPFPVPKPPQAWTSSGSNILPRPWGERGRAPMSVRGPQPFIRRSQSDRRPSCGVPSRAPVVSVAQTCGSEPAISIQGLEDGPAGEVEMWSDQTQFRGASRSASHPDLCIVGQALQRE